MARRKPAETPLMRQFLELKERHPDGILFFRCGDFYEMFFEDAVIAAEALDLTLTSRDKGKADAVPMAGLPHHAARGYIAKLTEQGFKVVLCEQTEDPKKAKGLVRREVVRIITPGIVIDDEVLDPKSARYIAAVRPSGNGFALSCLDVSTGEFRATVATDLSELSREISRIAPGELVLAEGDTEIVRALMRAHPTVPRTLVGDFDETTAVAELAAELGITLGDVGPAAALAVHYARYTQPVGQLPLSRLAVYRPGDSVVLDEAAITNLELVRTIMGGGKAGAQKKGSLLSVIDRTATAPGGRRLRQWLLYPLTCVAAIRRRQDAVAYMVERPGVREDTRFALKHIYDLERIAGRVSLGVATPRDLGQLRRSLESLPDVRDAIGSAIDLPGLLSFDDALITDLVELGASLASALVDEPPPHARDGGIVREGFSTEIDELRELARGGMETIAEIEVRERERTGIPTLKIKYNRVFGYYIEVTKANVHRVPEDYIRKQTIATAERYVTDELAELESKVLAAKESATAAEAAVFAALLTRVTSSLECVRRAGEQVSVVDCCAGLAEVAAQGDYCRPVVDDSGILEIRDGRHPVVETVLPDGEFVPNSCELDVDGAQIALVTGPNMAGKSTFMRQVAHVVLMAQMGSFVPAASARIGVVDKVFTRVGAADNLASGDSTFMVEMRETSAILAGASRRSLVILDEVGRGTSTFDGVSIAWAVTEFLHDAVGCRTLFATHYHELGELAELRDRIVNLSVSVREHRGRIVFMRQVVPGAANRSYGIEVAKLAGLPSSVVSRARQILGGLEMGGTLGPGSSGPGSQLSLFAGGGQQAFVDPGADAAAERLRTVDPNTMTPLEALNLVAELRVLVDG